MGELLQFVPRGKPIEIQNVCIVGNAIAQDVKAAAIERDDPSVFAMNDDCEPIELEHYMAPHDDCA